MLFCASISGKPETRTQMGIEILSYSLDFFEAAYTFLSQIFQMKARTAH
jgi:hypothetical protein